MKCFNCSKELQSHDQFCSGCGQKVDGNILTLRVLLKDFFENYLSLDTRFGRSIKPFLFYPGFLTLKFNSGIRKNFANPFRLYIICSILFFTVFTSYFVSVSTNNKEVIQLSPMEETMHPFDELDSLTRINLQDSLSASIIESLNQNSDSGFVHAFSSLSRIKQKKVGLILPDTLQQKMELDSDSILAQEKVSVDFTAGTKGIQFSFSDLDYKLLQKNKNNTDVSDEELLDQMDLGEMTAFNRFFAVQTIRVFRSDSAAVTKFILQNLSLIMFLVLPLSAALFLLFFYKAKMTYVEHLIHSVHLHAFTFLISAVLFFVLIFIPVESFWSDIFRLITSLVLLIYFMVSTRKVYQRSWIQTISKSIIMFFLYFFFVTALFVSEILISFLIY